MSLARRVLGAFVLAGMVTSVEARPPQSLTSSERATAAAMERARITTPQLRMFLQAMPKGGDLHNHALGAVFAEDQIAWAAARGMCAADTTYRLSPPPCAAGQTPVREIVGDYPRYSRLIDALSLRGYEQGVGDPMIPGYDRFFFAIDYSGAPLDPAKSFVIAREAATFDNVQYLELMTGGGKGQQRLIDAAVASGLDGTDPAQLDRLLEPLLGKSVAEARADFDSYEAEESKTLGCSGARPAAACDVAVRYLSVGFRTRSPAAVYASLLFSFAIAQADQRFVGVNLVGPEHDPVARRDYALHIRMLRHLRERFASIPLSLHAGELTLGVVPPRDLRSHIAQALEIGGLKRIGHGIDIAMETDGPAALKRMAADRIAVEINLTSNAVILGVRGKDHPLALYRAAKVPIVLGTDDEGLARSDMTNEFMRAAVEHGLDYRALKQIVRNSLEYSFLPGESLWRGEVGGMLAQACASPSRAGRTACDTFLRASPRAAQQYDLERRFRAFEAQSR